MAISIETAVSVVMVCLTAILLVLNFTTLRRTTEQNQRTLEQHEENMRINEQSLQLNKALLEENKRMIEREELNNRPKFRESQNGFHFDRFSGEPHFYLENIGGVPANVKSAQLSVTKDLMSAVKLIDVNKTVKPGAPIELKMSLPVSVFGHSVTRKDGQPLRKDELIFLQFSVTIEYTHADDTGKDIDSFVDVVESHIGKDYFKSEDYQCSTDLKDPSENTTWYNIFGTNMIRKVTEE
ncbi:MAG: hypothetical protein FWG19_00655 [Methanomassiliicoccaceae archaeon]|nr:hypothetical protein [Methanomassiliicoccaceae archaeon]